MKRKRSESVEDLELAMAASCQTVEQRAIVLYDATTVKRQKVDERGWLPSASVEEKKSQGGGHEKSSQRVGMDTRATKRPKLPIGVQTRASAQESVRDDMTTYQQGKYSTCSLLASINTIANSPEFQRLVGHRDRRFSDVYTAPPLLDTPGQLVKPYLQEMPSTAIAKAYPTRSATQPLVKKRLCDVEDEGITPPHALAAVMGRHGINALIEPTPGRYIGRHNPEVLINGLSEQLRNKVATECVERAGVSCFEHLVKTPGPFALPSVVAFETTMQEKVERDGQQYTIVRGVDDLLQVNVSLANTYTFRYKLVAAIAVVNVVEGDYATQHEQHAVGCIIRDGQPIILNAWPKPGENVQFPDWRRSLIDIQTSYGTLQSDTQAAPIFPIYMIEGIDFQASGSEYPSEKYTFVDLWPPATPSLMRGGSQHMPLYLWSLEGAHIALRGYPLPKKATHQPKKI